MSWPWTYSFIFFIDQNGEGGRQQTMFKNSKIQYIKTQLHNTLDSAAIHRYSYLIMMEYHKQGYSHSLSGVLIFCMHFFHPGRAIYVSYTAVWCTWIKKIFHQKVFSAWFYNIWIHASERQRIKCLHLSIISNIFISYVHYIYLLRTVHETKFIVTRHE